MSGLRLQRQGMAQLDRHVGLFFKGASRELAAGLAQPLPQNKMPLLVRETLQAKKLTAKSAQEKAWGDRR